MAKEYTIEKAFRPKDDSGEPQSFKAHDKTMWPWIVKVEGENFWFKKNTLENNEITPGDTIYGMFDEEEYEYEGQTKTKRTFVKRDRPDGSRDKVQARDGQSTASGPKTSQNGSQTSLGLSQETYIIQMLEELTGRREFQEDESVEGKQVVNKNISDEPLNLDDIPL